jgi:activator of 2-hydroxyglutaryl-CoA dehydratase
MSIFDRLGDVIKSYLNDEDETIFGSSQNTSRSKDADYHAAYEELNAYLNKDKARSYSWSDENPHNDEQKKTDEGRHRASYADYLNEEFARKQAERAAARKREQEKEAERKKEQEREAEQRWEQKQAKAKTPPPHMPEDLRKDFTELGIDFGSALLDCKSAYKTLLKKHHPDRHAGHPRNMKKATEKSVRINVSYRRIETWYETGKVE